MTYFIVAGVLAVAWLAWSLCVASARGEREMERMRAERADVVDNDNTP